HAIAGLRPRLCARQSGSRRAHRDPARRRQARLDGTDIQGDEGQLEPVVIPASAGMTYMAQYILVISWRVDFQTAACRSERASRQHRNAGIRHISVAFPATPVVVSCLSVAVYARNFMASRPSV